MTRHHWRVVEAMAALVGARILRRTTPFRWIARLGGCTTSATAQDAPGRPTADPVAAAVGLAVHRAAARLAWHSTCLDRALAGRLLLARRGVPSTLVFGVAKDDGHVQAHAWLVARGGTVCGGRDAPGFNPIAAFRPSPPRPATEG